MICGRCKQSVISGKTHYCSEGSPFTVIQERHPYPERGDIYATRGSRMILWRYQGSGLWLCIQVEEKPGYTELGRVEGHFHECGAPYYTPVRGIGRSQQIGPSQLRLEFAKRWVTREDDDLENGGAGE